ncbi:SDR family oxidoreductase [Salipiger sp. P9]|uniref:SDR family oxidoreductase n=1 Tax=Salipiger pentaromativorans TaxID=2943193 RepID=UPI00215700E6|nr:SDR family oxidoreductase [Salipiger pentaromativorans]MCR8547625.1 SDR family oxidoreductase [Salipiger pentaromativorans]
MRILITGANRGIGAALDRELTARCAEVIGTARNHPDYQPLDVTQPASVAALAERLDGAPLDALICNAGVYLDKGQALADGYPAQMWADEFAVNVTGVFLSVQALLPNLRQGSAPRIMIISSQMASHTRAPGGSYIYRASKAAALNLGRNLATDLKPMGIAVGIYHPGWVQTDMGGTAAEITPEMAARGLADRLEALGPGNTGCFETWDGQPHAY